MTSVCSSTTHSNRTLFNIIHCLKGVIKRHNGSLLAFCSSHDGRKGRSLAVATGQDGQILMKYFAGCSNHDIASTIGLNITALFLQTNNKYEPQTRSYINEWHILNVLLTAVRKILAEEALLEADIAYLFQAVTKINEAVSLPNEWIEEDVFSWDGLIGLTGGREND